MIPDNKPQSANFNKRRPYKDRIIGADTESVWSKIALEMKEDRNTYALNVPQKMERRKCIE